MINLTTGFVFFLSSVYGAATTTQNIDQTVIANSISTSTITTTIEATTMEEYVREYYKDTPILAEISKCESTFVHFTNSGNVLRGRADSNDVGLMQINERYHLERAKKLGYDIYSVEGNLAYAKYLYDKEGAAPWSASAKCWGKKLAAEVAVR